MLKREFLAILEKKLSRMDQTEREDVLCYFDELIEDRIETTGKSEEQVVYELGNLENIARKIMNSESTKSCERSIPIDDFDEEYNKEFVNRTKSMIYENGKTYTETTTTRTSNKTMWIIIACVTVFIWGPILLGALSAIFGILVAVAGCLLAFFIAGFAIGIGGIAVLVAGATLFSANTAFAILEIGVGLIMLGIAFIITPLLIKAGLSLSKLCIRAIKFLFSKIKGLFTRKKGGNVAYEN